MLYFVNSIILFSLALLDLSFLPRLFHILPRPLLVLPFLAILSLRDRTVSPLIMAGITGLVYDAAAGSHSFVFTLSFIVMALVAKIFFSAAQNYNYPRILTILVSIAMFISLLGSAEVISTRYTEPALYINLLIYILIVMVFLGLFSLVGRKYFDYLEKTTSERFR